MTTENNITVKVLAALNHVGIRYTEAYDLLIRSEVYEEEAELIDVYVSQLKAGLYYPNSKAVAEVAIDQLRRDKHYQHQVHDIALWIELMEEDD